MLINFYSEKLHPCDHFLLKKWPIIVDDIYALRLEAALVTFAQARPPGVYKQDFLDVLSHRYGDDQRLIGSPWPAWCEERERVAEGNKQYKVSGTR